MKKLNRKIASLPHSRFFNFSEPPPPGKVNKIYFAPFKKRGVRTLSSHTILACKRGKLLKALARAFNRSEVNRTVTLDISKAFDIVWYANLLHKFKFYRISGQIFGLISSFLSNRQLRVVLDGKSS